MIDSGLAAMDSTLIQLDLFFENAYQAFPLGEAIYDADASPLANAIDRGIFREAFSEIFEAFTKAGTFESYLDVFRNIFGDDVDVDFTVPDPGELEITIVATGLQLSEFVSRYIEDDVYFFDEIIDYDDDNIVFQTVKGFQTQYELEQMLFEMVPAGIATTINLTVGEP